MFICLAGFLQACSASAHPESKPKLTTKILYTKTQHQEDFTEYEGQFKSQMREAEGKIHKILAQGPTPNDKKIANLLDPDFDFSFNSHTTLHRLDEILARRAEVISKMRRESSSSIGDLDDLSVDSNLSKLAAHYQPHNTAKKALESVKKYLRFEKINVSGEQNRCWIRSIWLPIISKSLDDDTDYQQIYSKIHSPEWAHWIEQIKNTPIQERMHLINNANQGLKPT